MRFLLLAGYILMSGLCWFFSCFLGKSPLLALILLTFTCEKLLGQFLAPRLTSEPGGKKACAPGASAAAQGGPPSQTPTPVQELPGCGLRMGLVWQADCNPR